MGNKSLRTIIDLSNLSDEEKAKLELNCLKSQNQNLAHSSQYPRCRRCNNIHQCNHPMYQKQKYQ
jgi:hypothetical protein